MPEKKCDTVEPEKTPHNYEIVIYKIFKMFTKASPQKFQKVISEFSREERNENIKVLATNIKRHLLEV